MGIVRPVNSKTVYSALTYAGAIPFVACALLPYAGVPTLGPFGEAGVVLMWYGLAIASFLAGTHWAFELAAPGKAGLPLFVLSNAVVVLTWLTALAAPPFFALVDQLAVFALLLLIDSRLFVAGVVDEHYWRLRKRITAIVLLALLAGLGQEWIVPT